MHKFIWSCHRQPYIKYICISIYAHFIGYWHCMCKMYIASLNAPLILETLQYWCFLKQNAIFNTVCIADPYFVFVKLNVAYYLAISFFFQLSCQIMIFMWFLSTPKKFLQARLNSVDCNLSFFVWSMGKSRFIRVYATEDLAVANNFNYYTQYTESRFDQVVLKW